VDLCYRIFATSRIDGINSTNLARTYSCVNDVNPPSLEKNRTSEFVESHIPAQSANGTQNAEQRNDKKTLCMNLIFTASSMKSFEEQKDTGEMFHIHRAFEKS
jgi:hypothetical protein